MTHPLLFPPKPLPEDGVEIARIQGAWGVKGWLKVMAYSADTAALFETGHWHLMPPQGRYARGFQAFAGPVMAEVAAVKWHADGLVAQINGVLDRDQAEALKGASVWMSRSAFPPAPSGEYYWVDLIGCEVFNREGVPLGVVRDLMPTGPHSVLCLEQSLGDTKVERMVPFVAVYVDDVDLSTRRITVDWQPDY